MRKTSMLTLTAMTCASMALISACHSTSREVPKVNPDETITDLPIEVRDASALSNQQRQIYLNIKTKKPISFALITNLMVSKHVKAAQRSDVKNEDIQSFLKAIAPSKQELFENQGKIKLSYEEKIQGLNGGKPLVYNRDKTNIVDIYKDNRMQCYSGTYLYELVRRQSGAGQFRSKNEVVIFENGHILPGYMIPSKTGFRLIGIETTESGAARKTFGDVKNLSDIRVVDAEMFAIIDIFQEHLVNPSLVMQRALEKTAQRYHLPLKQLEASLQTVKASTEATRKQLNQSIFAFGESDVKEGDIDREGSGDDGTAKDDNGDTPTGAVSEAAPSFEPNFVAITATAAPSQTGLAIEFSNEMLTRLTETARNLQNKNKNDGDGVLAFPLKNQSSPFLINDTFILADQPGCFLVLPVENLKKFSTVGLGRVFFAKAPNQTLQLSEDQSLNSPAIARIICNQNMGQTVALGQIFDADETYIWPYVLAPPSPAAVPVTPPPAPASDIGTSI